jgi:hypothetical protein
MTTEKDLLKMERRPARAAGRVLWLAFCLAMTAGCSAWNLDKAMPWPFADDKPAKPEKVVAIWTDTVLYQPGQPPVRGFGGRLMFFEAKNDKPVKVDGTLVIYAFDETKRDPGNPKPDRKYVFPPDQLPGHYSLAKCGKSDIGHSYSVWLPWDAVGGDKKEISLVVRFQPKGAAEAVVGEPSRQLLPGKTTAGQDATKLTAAGAMIRTPPVPPQNQDQPVQQTSYNAPPATIAAAGGSEDAPLRRMTTTTITIPAGMAYNPLLPTGAISGPASSGQPNPQEVANKRPPISTPTTPNATLTPGASPTTQGSPTAASPAATSPSLQPRFSLPRFQTLNEPFVQPGRDRGPWPQPPGGSPSAPGLPPGSASGSGSPASPPAAGSATN